tara:strand:- start:84 stop:620 length:537 start_codon:yes stop_codon:yes gene_type:complete
MIKFNIKKLTILAIFSVLLSACGKDFIKYSPAKDNPVKGAERAKKNVEEGRGVTLGGLTRRGGTNYEFSTSNPLWRASLEILDFLPLTTVDYSGGMIISDWYTDNNASNSESIKITIRFLSNDVRSDSLKIIVHKKKCSSNTNCSVKILPNSTISQELRTTIIKKAALLEKESRTKKR